MLMIRFQRIGRTNDPAFRIAVMEKARAAQTGHVLELLGTYNPHSKALTLNEAQVKHWLSVGAQPTGSIHNLFVNKGIIEGKKINVLPKKSPIKPEGEAGPEAAAPAAEAPAAPAEAETLAPSEAEVAAEAEPAPVSAPAETPAEAPEAPETPAG